MGVKLGLILMVIASTAATIEARKTVNTIYGENIDVDTILTMPDLFYKPEANEQLMNSQEFGIAAPDKPVLYYHVPKSTSVNVYMENFVQLIPNFEGLMIDSFPGASTVLDKHFF